MLTVFDSLKDLQFGKLAQIYCYDLEQETDFYDYLRRVFFRTKGAVYCVWQEQGTYLSALRLEPYQDGLILTGLETAPDFRQRGYATALVRAVLDSLEGQKVYSHILRGNVASIAVHRRAGFRRILRYAVFLDKSVSAQADTYCFDSGTAR